MKSSCQDEDHLILDLVEAVVQAVMVTENWFLILPVVLVDDLTVHVASAQSVGLERQLTNLIGALKGSAFTVVSRVTASVCVTSFSASSVRDLAILRRIATIGLCQTTLNMLLMQLMQLQLRLLLFQKASFCKIFMPCSKLKKRSLPRY